jgi:hypothetical protein
MTDGPTATATIELSLGVQTPEGVLTDGQGRARRFRGWIELAAAIEDWRTASATPTPPGNGRGDINDAPRVKERTRERNDS